jgi:hypothetical protein
MAQPPTTHHGAGRPANGADTRCRWSRSAWNGISVPPIRASNHWRGSTPVSDIEEVSMRASRTRRTVKSLIGRGTPSGNQ